MIGPGHESSMQLAYKSTALASKNAHVVTMPPSRLEVGDSTRRWIAEYHLGRMITGLMRHLTPGRLSHSDEEPSECGPQNMNTQDQQTHKHT